MKKLYISTPVTSRQEYGMEARMVAASVRSEFLKEGILRDERFAKFDAVVCPHDVNPIEKALKMSDAEAMGRCVDALLSCDAVFLDKHWQQSKGCRLEYHAAVIYGKEVYFFDEIAPPVGSMDTRKTE